MPPLKNPRHEAFVQNLTDPGKPTFLNQTKAYSSVNANSGIEAARRSASALMTNPDVKKRYEDIMEEKGLTDEYITKKHKEIVESGDGNLTYKGIRMYHELKGRIGGSLRANITQNNYTQNNLNVQAIDNKEVMSKLDDMLG